jgi:hypothetical protein
MYRTVAFLLAILTLLTAVFAGGAVGESFGLSVANSVETPERTITHDVLGKHTFNAVGVTTPGDPLSVTVTAPSGETHFLDLYNGRDRVDTIRIDNGSETVSIQTDELAPGSYFLRILSDGNTEVVYPVVIEGYDISVEQTKNASTDELEVSATVTPTASTGTPESVETVVWNDETEKQETLNSKTGDSYAGTVSLSTFGDGSYQVYVAAVGEETIYDRNEILAIGEGESKTGNDESVDDGTDGGTTGGGSTGGGSTNDGTTGGTATNQPVDDSIDNGTTNESVDEDIDGNTTDDTVTNNGTDDSEISDETADEESSDDDNVIEPTNSDGTGANSSSTDDDAQTDDNVPLSPVTAVGALVASALLAARRSQ